MAFDDNHNSIKHQAHSIVYQGGKEEGGGGQLLEKLTLQLSQILDIFKQK